MTRIGGAGSEPARPIEPGRDRKPAPPPAEPPTRSSADGLAGLSKDTVVRGPGAAGPAAGADAAKAKGRADLTGLEKAATGHFEAAAAAGRLFETLSAKVGEVAKLAESGNAEQLFAATKEMQEMNQSFNLQYLQLQQKMQAQNRQFTLMSNIMKTKHDTAKSAIDNIR